MSFHGFHGMYGPFVRHVDGFPYHLFFFHFFGMIGLVGFEVLSFNQSPAKISDLKFKSDVFELKFENKDDDRNF